MDSPKIIYQDGEVLVLDKPSGWVTNDSSTTLNQNTIQTWIRTNHKSLITNHLEFRDGVVHRLDKETSGILVVAKTVEAFTNLQKQFKERKVEKEYMALVHGKPRETGVGKIDAPVGRLPWRRDRFGVLLGGREAVTYFKIIKVISHKSEAYSLLQLQPKTGRTHQIRIHLKHIGHPIVGDEFYAGRKTAKNDRTWCPRLFLHAVKIKFLHPKTFNQVEFESPLPDDLTDILKSI
jgi:23S rRNA pseudouridine1911/1915/1917 synthase